MSPLCRHKQIVVWAGLVQVELFGIWASVSEAAFSMSSPSHEKKIGHASVNRLNASAAGHLYSGVCRQQLHCLPPRLVCPLQDCLAGFSMAPAAGLGLLLVAGSGLVNVAVLVRSL